MDGIHDLGGVDGFGRVEAECDEPVFHAPWEGRVMAMQRAMMYAGAWNIDMLRYAQERLPPRVYLGASYYERWLLATESSVVERGVAPPNWPVMPCARAAAATN
jgi:nitrile hydratase